VDTRCDEPAIGSEVTALVNGSECGGATSGPYSDGEQLSFYAIEIPLGLPGCGEAGATVEFTIDGRAANQTGILQEGDYRADIYVGADFAHYAGNLTCNGEPCYQACTQCGQTVNVAAFVGGTRCSSTMPSGWLLGGGYGDLSVPCGNPGDTVTFKVDGMWAAESTTWMPGFHQQDLTVEGNAGFRGYACVDTDCGDRVFGLPVVAKIGDVECASTTTGMPYDGYTVSRYELTVPSAAETPGCGTTGSSVEFYIAGRLANQAASWSAGQAHLDLSVGDEFMHLIGSLTCNGGGCYGPCDAHCPGAPFIEALVGDTSCGSDHPTGYLLTGEGYGNLVVNSDERWNGCGTVGAEVRFKVNGITANETILWEPGFFTFNLSIQFLEVAWGDLDCDGTITSRDAQGTLRLVLDHAPLSVTEPCPAPGTEVPAFGGPYGWGDTACNGGVDTLDAQLIVRWALSHEIFVLDCPLGETVRIPIGAP